MKNFTKQNIKQFTSRLSARWLIMALMLLVGTSSAWAARIYYVNVNKWSSINCYAWNESTNVNETAWPGTSITEKKCSFKVAGYDVYYYDTNGTSNMCIFNDGSAQTANLTIANGPYFYGETGRASVKDIYDNEAWMFYISQDYGGNICLKANNNTVGTVISNKYVIVSKSDVSGKVLTVSNNCSQWNGTGVSNAKGGTEVNPGCFYKTGSANSITKPSTLSSLSIPSSISKADASSVSVTAKSTSATSSGSAALKAQYFVDNVYVAESAQLSTSGTSTTLDLSSFSDGSHTLSVILTDGTISYPDAKTATFTIISCTKSVSNETGRYSNGEITLSAEFNTCGSAFIGFQWKEKNSDWCYEDNSSNPCFIPLGPNNKSNETVTTTVNKSGGTFVFRPYIVVGSTAQEWLYGTDFEVATCTSINDFTLTFEDGNELGLANNTQANLSTDAEVNWSSSNNQIASVSNSGVVTGYKWGTATITATTTGNDEYCANQPASANITIKEFPRISISGTTPFCGETTELTASIDNISNDNTEYTISWYKEGDANVKGTGATFNASEGVYYAKVTGDFLETATSDQLTVTKKSTPTVANFNYEAPDNLEYNSETKTATVIWNSTQGGAITIAYSSSNPAVTLVDPINVGTYYVFVSTVEDEDFCAVNNLYIGTFTITCPSIAAPDITTSATICAGTQVTLSSYNGNNANTVKWYSNSACAEEVTQPVTPTNGKVYYAKAKDGECLSSEYTELTINVTTTPVITGVTVTTPDKPVELTSSVENTVWSYNGGSLSSNEGKTVDFTASSTGAYIITAKNKENENCSASVTVNVRESLYYIYIRRPKNGETDTNYDAYGYWYEFSNNDQKGGASWFKEGEAGSGIGTNDEAKDPNYGGDAPEFSFEDCNDYIWDAFAPANLIPNYKFHVHAPNGSDSKGHATFTQTTTISSMSTDLYYKIKKWDGSSQGVVLTQVTGNNIPTPRPEVATPTISMEPIICSGTNAIVEITNPQNGVTYTLTYNGETQGDPISYNGSNEVKFSVNQAGTYMVNAETTEGTCKGSATSRGENLQIISTSVSFSQSEYTTTPWIPVTVKINVPKGYSYTYTDTDITSITPAENAPIKKVNGTEITYTFPRPNAEGTVDPWGIGNTTGDGWGEKTYQVEATITGAPDACDSATATVKLQDEGNDKCTTTNN